MVNDENIQLESYMVMIMSFKFLALLQAIIVRAKPCKQLA